MRTIKLSMISLGLCCVGIFGQGISVVRVTIQAAGLEPQVAKPGTVLTITGTALDSSKVEEIYLTDHRFDMKVKVLEQTETTLKIRVPPFATPGRQQLLILTRGQNPQYLEMPLYVTIEGDDQVAVAEAPKTRTLAGVQPPWAVAGDAGNNNP